MKFKKLLLSMIMCLILAPQASSPTISTSTLKTIKNALPKSFSWTDTKDTIKDISSKTAKKIVQLISVKKFNIGDFFNALKKLKTADLKNKFINNVHTLTKVPGLAANKISQNLPSISKLTELDISPSHIGELLKEGFDLKEIASQAQKKGKNNAKQFIEELKNKLNSAKKLISTLPSISSAPNLNDIINIIESKANQLTQAYEYITDKALPSALRDTLKKAFDKVTDKLKSLVKSQIHAHKSVQQLVAARGNDLINIVEKARNLTGIKIKQTLENDKTIAILTREKLNAIPLPEPIKQLLQEIEKDITSLISKISGQSYSVTKGTRLDPQEVQFLQARSKKTAPAIKKLTGIDNISPAELPVIAFCASGGGYRAMVGARGFYLGADQMGLLNATSYISCLSGGTWATYPWLLKKSFQKSFTTQDSVNNLSSTMFKATQDPFLLKQTLQNKEQSAALAANVFVKFFVGEPISVGGDVYGMAVGNSLLQGLFKSKTFKLSIHNMSNFSKTGDSPLPLGTAIVTNNNIKEWLEVTPFTAGSNYLNAYIPTEAFGSSFSNCKTTTTTPAQFIGFFLGTFGSAFALNTTDFLRESGLNERILNTPVLGTILKKLDIFPITEAKDLIAAKRPLASVLNNFCYECPGTQLSSEKTLKLVDAGLAFNLPLPPLVERKERNINIIFIIDMSGDMHDPNNQSPELIKAIDYFARKGIPFPIKKSELNKRNVALKPYTIFKFTPKEMKKHKLKKNLTIVYFPWCASEAGCLNSWCNTFTFDYTKSNIQDLAINCMADNVKNAKEAISTAIRDSILEQRPGHALDPVTKNTKAKGKASEPKTKQKLRAKKGKKATTAIAA